MVLGGGFLESETTENFTTVMDPDFPQKIHIQCFAHNFRGSLGPRLKNPVFSICSSPGLPAPTVLGVYDPISFHKATACLA